MEQFSNVQKVWFLAVYFPLEIYTWKQWVQFTSLKEHFFFSQQDHTHTHLKLSKQLLCSLRSTHTILSFLSWCAFANYIMLALNQKLKHCKIKLGAVCLLPVSIQLTVTFLFIYFIESWLEGHLRWNSVSCGPRFIGMLLTLLLATQS